MIELVHQVAAFQLEHFRAVASDAVNMKASRETVSFVDVESEHKLVAGLKLILPNAGVYGEETGQSGDESIRWVIDPIDGTTNYLSGVDHFAISVALVCDNEPTFGIVYKSVSAECWVAQKGEGVRYNGDIIEVDASAYGCSTALFATGFPYRSDDLCKAFFGAAEEVLKLGLGIRRTGSAALDLAYVGVGWYQGYWESDLQPYDVAASMVMLKESGCVMTNESGKPYDLFSDRIMVVGYPSVHRALLEVVGRHY